LPLFTRAEVDAIYANRKRDVQNARHGTAPDAGNDPAPSTNSLDPAAIYERRRQAVAASGSR
jgi:hypothetical protein